MAIDLPEAIPSIINTFKRSNSAKTLQKLTKNLKTSDKSPRFSFFRSKSNRTGQCRCCFPDCKECQKKVNGHVDFCAKKTGGRSGHYDNNNETELEPECAQTLLSENDVKSDLNFDNVTDWNLRDNEGEAFPNKYWKKEKKADRKYYNKRRDDETLLTSSDNVAKRRKRVFLLSTLGVVLLSAAIFIRLTDPVEHILNWKLSLSPGTFALNLWKKPPVTVYVKIYIFNVTNPIEFLAGKEKLKLDELGPYVFIETLENTNPVFNKNGTLTYVPRRTVRAAPELSVGNPKNQTIVVPNIPFLGLGSMIANSSMFTNMAFLTLSKYLQSQPFLNLTVHDYLWGYNDPLVKMANRIVANWISFAKFGLMDRMYDEGDNLITMRLHDNGLNVSDKGYLPRYTIDTWNGSPGLPAWGYKDQDYDGREKPLRPKDEERCKFIRGATDGVVFPRNMSPNITHQIYRKTFCRIIPIEFDRAGVTQGGLPAYWYKLPENVFDNQNNPAQACYCNPNTTQCLPKGLSDITPCYYNIPAAVSFPHFYGGDPKLANAVEGLKPDKFKHGSTIILQPDLGMPMDFITRIQTNIVMRKIRYNAKITPFSELTLPIFWVELSMDGLPTHIKILLYIVVFIVPTLQTALMVIGFIAGTALVIYSMISYLFLTGIIQMDPHRKRKYSAIKISPIINKSHIVNISRRNSIITAFNNSRKNSIISLNHKAYSNDI